MSRLIRVRGIAILTLGLLIGATDLALAATIRVASNGTDGASCGSASDPCRSINMAIANAQDGDKIQVGPGRYSRDSEPLAPCPECLILVDRDVTIESTKGFRATVIDAQDEESIAVWITASGASLGRTRKGFTITDATEAGVRVAYGTTGVTLSDLYSTANSDYGYQIHGVGNVVEDCTAIDNGSGFLLQGSDHSLTDCTAASNDVRGFTVGASSASLSDCLAISNGEDGFLVYGPGVSISESQALINGLNGYASTVGTTHVRSLAIGNTTNGFSLASTAAENAVVDECAALGNGVGITVDAGDSASITRSNLYDSFGCGLDNLGSSISVSDNFWGHADGPGADPADDICGNPVAIDPANREISQAYP